MPDQNEPGRFLMEKRKRSLDNADLLPSSRDIEPRDVSSFSRKARLDLAASDQQRGTRAPPKQTGESNAGIGVRRAGLGEQGMVQEPISSSISQEQLQNEVRGIYQNLSDVEDKCIKVDAGSTDTRSLFTGDAIRMLVTLHSTLLYEHHDFLMPTQHPSSSPGLKSLASKYNMPARMWRYGIHSFLELLRHRRPGNQDSMIAFIYLAYQMIALLLETVPVATDTWVECLGDLARYRMAIEDDHKTHSIWGVVASSWYSLAALRHPEIGRLNHHLGILSRPTLRRLILLSKSLITATRQDRLSAEDFWETVATYWKRHPEKDPSDGNIWTTVTAYLDHSVLAEVSYMIRPTCRNRALAEDICMVAASAWSRPLAEDYCMRGLVWSQLGVKIDRWFETSQTSNRLHAISRELRAANLQAISVLEAVGSMGSPTCCENAIDECWSEAKMLLVVKDDEALASSDNRTVRKTTEARPQTRRRLSSYVQRLSNFLQDSCPVKLTLGVFSALLTPTNAIPVSDDSAKRVSDHKRSTFDLGGLSLPYMIILAGVIQLRRTLKHEADREDMVTMAVLTAVSGWGWWYLSETSAESELSDALIIAASAWTSFWMNLVGACAGRLRARWIFVILTVFLGLGAPAFALAIMAGTDGGVADGSPQMGSVAMQRLYKAGFMGITGGTLVLYALQRLAEGCGRESQR